ncbi:MAG: hypothetical protein J3Q66DRAFT_436693 [Benniella sp.]|nr:MAG: hypothetical protein J3Q66DRAFT_436693 [Benniella sp.]
MTSSSAGSVLSASGTLVSKSGTRRRSLSSTTVLQHHFDRISSMQTFTTMLDSAAATLDPQQLKTTMNDLNRYLEQFEELNDQILEAMTSLDDESLGLRLDLRALSTLSSAQPLPSGRAQGDTGAQDLEEQRRTAALAIADLILVL